MPGSFLESDLPIFTNTDEFGYVATWTPSGGSATTVNGVFDDVNLVINPYDGSTEGQTDAVFVCSLSDVSGVRQKDTIEVNGDVYVVKVVPSSTSNNMIRLGLRRQ